MKKLSTVLVAGLFTASVFAQVPQKMSYQSVVRNSGNALVVSGKVGMRISILQGSATGTAVYSETQSPTTNANGLISIEFGGAAGFDAINWANGPYFIKVETDPTGGSNYTITGTSQLMSVPYALYAKSAGTTGDKGPQGDKGLPGDKGVAGDKGEIGDKGVQGDKGVAGDKGETGDKGLPGDKGEKGDAGDPAVLFDNTLVSTDKTWTSSKVKEELDLKANGASLSAVATSGSYDDLSNKPIIPAAADGSETKVTAGTNISITGKGTTQSPYVVNASSSTSLPDYASVRISNSFDAGTWSTPDTVGLTIEAPNAGVSVSGDKIALKANKLYEISAHFYIYNTSEPHTFKLQDITNSIQVGTEFQFGQESNTTVNYITSMTSFFIKPSSDISIQLLHCYGKSGNLIGRITVKEIR